MKMLDFHTNHSKLGTILVTEVEDPSKFGVIKVKDGANTIENFVEKPSVLIGNTVKCSDLCLQT